MTPYYEREKWAGWLASIREQPNDDHRRLFCADWLDELETEEAAERAELIRLHVELAKPQFFTRAGNPRLRRKRAARERARSIILRYAAALAPGVEVVTSDRWRRTLGNTSAAVWYERGFVTRVSAPLAVLNGGECGWCAGHGDFQIESGAFIHRGCPACHGTGRTTGVLGGLLRREPITAAGIEVVDREPIQIEGGSWSVAQWRLPAHQSDLSASLPYETFPTPDAARLALGEALYRLHGPKSEVTT